MTDLERAKAGLAGHSVCLCKNGDLLTADGRGIAPLLHLVPTGASLAGSAAADLIVGKAAALLFVRAGVACVFGKVMSESGRDVLLKHGVPCSFETLTKRIINRAGTGLCPMEQAVQDVDDPEEAYRVLCAAAQKMTAMARGGQTNEG